MLRYIIDNDQEFFTIYRNYLNKFRDSVATADDFRAVAEEVTGLDLKPFFNQWFYGEGYPVFSVYWKTSHDSLYVDSYETGTSTKTPLFKIPFELKIMFSNGDSALIKHDQNSPKVSFSEVFPGKHVTSVVFDPQHYLLASSQVIEIPSTTGYMSVQPNPFDESFNINFSDKGIKRTIQISNVAGEVVKKLQTDSASVKINLTGYHRGIYLIRVADRNGEFVSKVVKD